MACTANQRCEGPDQQLISRARNGDEDAIAELFRRHYTHSISVARRILPSQEEFLDAVQSAFFLRSETSNRSAKRQALKRGSLESSKTNA